MSIDRYYGGYGYGSGASGAMGVCAIVAIIAGILLYFLFLSPKNDKKFAGFVGWLYDFLAFKKLLVEAILKVVYLICACFLTLVGIVTLFSSSFRAGLTILVVGNVMLRFGYEFLLLLIIICKNTSEINKKLSGKESSAADMFVSQVELPQSVIDQFTAKTAPTASTTTPKAFCKNCGQPLQEDALFCASCGQKND